MDKFMDNPWFLRFIALGLAIVLFFTVKAEEGNSPGNSVVNTMDILRDIPVEVYYDNENLVVTGAPEKVTMTIEGPTNLVQTTKLLKDFSLILDLRDLPMGKHTVRIQHENISEKLDVRLDPATVEVEIEEKITKQFKVDPEFNERLLAEDFTVVRKEVEPAYIDVTGPKSVIESIEFVKVSATGEPGIRESFEQRARVRVLDRDLNKLNVTIDPEEVVVKVEIEEYYKDLPVVLNERGTPQENVVINELSTRDDTIRLYGPRKVLDEMQQFTVDVDISAVKGTETLDLALERPKGVSKMSLDKLKVRVEATVTPTENVEQDEANVPQDQVPATETKNFNKVPIVVRGLDEQFTSTIKQPRDGTVMLTVTANEQIMQGLKASDFTVYVDASNMKDIGEQTLPLAVEGPANIQWKLSDSEVIMDIGRA